MTGSPLDHELLAALAESQRLGMLGSGPIEQVVEHAGAFVSALAAVSGTVVDLGSGGGVPGLVIARARPDLHVLLVDRRTARTDHLHRLVGRLALRDRVDVVGTDVTALRARLDPVEAVISRAFGTPAATLSAGAPLLAEHGVLIVSEPPGGDQKRWPAQLLRRHGVARVAWADTRVVVIRRVSRETEDA